MCLVHRSQPLGNLLRMVEDSSLKSILARETGLLLGTDIAKLVREDGVRQTGGAPGFETSRLDVRTHDARSCSTLDKSSTANQQHAPHILSHFRFPRLWRRDSSALCRSRDDA